MGSHIFRILGVRQFFRLAIALVSGVSGEKGKDGSEKGREVKERNA